MIELDHQQVDIRPEDYLDGLASQWLNLLTALEPKDLQSIKHHQDTLFELGAAEQKVLWNMNQRMQHPFQKVLIESQDAGKVNKLLQTLQTKVIKIKPPQNSVLARLKNMFLLLFSWQESTWHMWLQSYPLYKQEISEIIVQLEQCQQQFNRNNKLLMADKQELNAQTERLKNWFDLACLLVTKIKAAITQNSALNAASKDLIGTTFLQVIQQRVLELQQQLLIARQTMMTLDLFMTQNKSQIRSINQTIYTTTSVIDVTAGIAMLEQGDKNLKKIDSHKKSLNASIDRKTLKQARHTINHALNLINEAQYHSKQSYDQLMSKSNFPSQH